MQLGKICDPVLCNTTGLTMTPPLPGFVRLIRPAIGPHRPPSGRRAAGGCADAIVVSSYPTPAKAIAYDKSLRI